MKLATFVTGIFLIPSLSFAQSVQPDTLQLETKAGQKIILIGKDIGSFKTVKVDSMIQNALISVKDSLTSSGVEHKNNHSSSGRTTRPSLHIAFPSVGAGLIKDKISAFYGITMDFMIEKRDLKTNEYMFSSSGGLALNVFHLYEKDPSGNILINKNLFLEGKFEYGGNGRKWPASFDRGYFGGGWLFHREGTVLNRNTFKLFSGFQPKNSFVRIQTEFYFNGFFKQVFPGITISNR